MRRIETAVAATPYMRSWRNPVQLSRAAELLGKRNQKANVAEQTDNRGSKLVEDITRLKQEMDERLAKLERSRKKGLLPQEH